MGRRYDRLYLVSYLENASAKVLRKKGRPQMESERYFDARSALRMLARSETSGMIVRN